MWLLQYVVLKCNKLRFISAPDIPIIENVTVSTQNGSANGNINVTWKVSKVCLCWTNAYAYMQY